MAIWSRLSRDWAQGGGERYVTLHTVVMAESIGHLSSSSPGELVEVSRIFLPIENKMSGSIFTGKNWKKVDLSEVSKTQSCLIFLDFLPDIVKKSIVRYFY